MDALDPEVFGPESPCFGCSPRHPIGMKLRFSRDGDAVVTRFVPPEVFQGPPGLMHGGLVTTLGDEIAAWTVIGLRERFGFTASIEARLLKPIRIGVEVVGRGRVASENPRMVNLDVELEQDGQLAFRGKFTFVLLDAKGAERLLGRPLPEAWRRFAR